MSHTIAIFGASGDLTSRKLIPALFRLYEKDRLPPDTSVVGIARSELSSEQWRQQLAEKAAEYAGGEFRADAWQPFSTRLHYHRGDIENAADFQSLATLLDELEGSGESTRVYYLATKPNLYGPAVDQLGQSGLADEQHGKRRIVIEKPFGTDFPTSRELNRQLHTVFEEEQVYRIDHYLGKESVQNLLVLRFANSIFEPIWNRNYIDNVQITVAEEVSVGRRGGYYDGAGVLRDMFQNHLLQLLTITAMEAPARYEAGMVRDEKVKILRAIRPMAEADFAEHTLRGQYDGYLAEPGVPAESQTATFGIVRLLVDNWRWKGVPFYLRSGKAMSCRTTQIVIEFREPPLMLFADGPRQSIGPNRLVIQIQPAEGIQLHFNTKVPDAGMNLRLTDLDFRFGREFSAALPDAYQRLLLDALVGDASLFARSDEVELAWKIIDPIIAAWNSPAAPQLESYPSGQWGPLSASEWIGKDRQWFDVCPVLH